MSCVGYYKYLCTADVIGNSKFLSVFLREGRGGTLGWKLSNFFSDSTIKVHFMRFSLVVKRNTSQHVQTGL